LIDTYLEIEQMLKINLTSLRQGKQGTTLGKDFHVPRKIADSKNCNALNNVYVFSEISKMKPKRCQFYGFSLRMMLINNLYKRV